MTATWVPIFGNPHLGSLLSVQAATEAAPTLASEGLSVESGAAFDVWAEADQGETFTGLGVFRGYRYEPAIGWGMMPSADVGVPDTANGERRVVLGTFTITNPRGRFALIADAVGVTGGGVTLYFVATRKTGGLL